MKNPSEEDASPADEAFEYAPLLSTPLKFIKL